MSGYSAAWSSAFDWGSKGPEFKSPYPDHFFLPWFQGKKNMKPEKASLHGSTEPLHTVQPCFIRRQACFIKRLFRWSSSISFRYEAFAFRKYEAQASEDACIIRNFSDDPTPVDLTGFFCFKSLAWSDICIENTRKTRVFFRFKFSVWRIERTGERHKAAKILRFAVCGDTAFMLKIGWFFAFQVEKNKSPTIFLWIKTLRSLCPRLFYLNTFGLNQQ